MTDMDIEPPTNMRDKIAEKDLIKYNILDISWIDCYERETVCNHIAKLTMKNMLLICISNTTHCHGIAYLAKQRPDISIIRMTPSAALTPYSFSSTFVKTLKVHPDSSFYTLDGSGIDLYVGATKYISDFSRKAYQMNRILNAAQPFNIKNLYTMMDKT
jgi:hypothetical protein